MQCANFSGLGRGGLTLASVSRKKISKISSPYGTSPKACLVLESIMERRKVKIKLLKYKGFQ